MSSTRLIVASILPILLLLLGLWFWLDSARARELATALSRAACDRYGLQFLDDTVALERLGVIRTPRGLRFRRRFRFEYSEEGLVRHGGRVVLVGIELETLDLPRPPADVRTFAAAATEETPLPANVIRFPQRPRKNESSHGSGES